MNIFGLMRRFTIRFRMIGAIGVVLVLLGLLGGAGMLGMFRIHAMSEEFIANEHTATGHLRSCAARWAPSAAMRRT